MIAITKCQECKTVEIICFGVEEGADDEQLILTYCFKCQKMTHQDYDYQEGGAIVTFKEEPLP